MATRRMRTNEIAETPVFDRETKMSLYEFLFDEDVKKMRATFYRNIFLNYSPQPTDKMWTVEPGFEHRVDLISNKFYNTSRFDWVIEGANDIKDPLKDVVIGKKLIIPSMSNIYARL